MWQCPDCSYLQEPGSPVSGSEPNRGVCSQCAVPEKNVRDLVGATEIDCTIKVAQLQKVELIFAVLGDRHKMSTAGLKRHILWVRLIF